MNNEGILGALFDFSFSSFVTTKIVKVLYILGVALSAFIALIILVGGLASGSVFKALGGIILAPIAFLIYVLVCRIWLELVVVVFRIAENTAVIAAASSSPGSGAAPMP